MSAVLQSGPGVCVHLDEAIACKEDVEVRKILHAVVPPKIWDMPVVLPKGNYRVLLTVTIVEDKEPLHEVPSSEG